MKVLTKKTFVYFLLGSFLAFISLFSACSDKDKNVAITGVSLDVTSDLALNVGESKQLIATVAPADATDKKVTWSSTDITKVTVDPTGLVKAIAAGEAAVKAKAGDKEASLKVTVIALPVPVLTWSPPGDTHSAQAGGAPFTKAAVLSGVPGCNGTITYSIVPAAGVASVNAATGEVTPSATIEGNTVTATVTAASSAVTGVCASTAASYTLTITTAPVPVLTWSPAGDHSARAGSEPFTKTAVLSGVSGCNGTITYSIVPAAGIASINANTGEVTPAATIEGNTVTATVTAASSAVTGVCASTAASYTLTITTAPVPALVWSPAGDHSARAGSAPFTKTAALSGVSGCNGTITYSIVPAAGVASINAATGEVTPAATIAGSAVTATVTAASSAVAGVCASATASYTLTITAPPAPALTWSPAGNTHSVRAGSEPFTKTVTVSGCNAAVTYSIVPATGVASINANTGEVTPAATITGDQVTAVITAASSAVAGVCASATATYTLTVTKLPLNAVTLNEDPVEKTYGDAAFSVKQAACAHGEAVYSALGAGLALNGATLTINGANTEGATVSATCPASAQYASETKSYLVKIAKKAFTFAFNNPTTSMVAGTDITTNVATASGLAGNDTPEAATGGIRYVSSDPSKATVHPTTGAVRALLAGNADITASCSPSANYLQPAAASYRLTITSPPVPVLTWSPAGNTHSAQAGSHSFTKTAALSGVLGCNAAVTYSIVPAAGVASINAATGEVTPAATIAGNTVTATVTAASSAVTGVCAAATASYTLTITRPPVPTLTWSPPGDHSVRAGSEPFTKTAALSGVSGCNATVTYSIVPATGAASINASTGQVTPIGYLTGNAVTATVTAASSPVAGVCASTTATYTLTVTPIPVMSWTAAPPNDMWVKDEDFVIAAAVPNSNSTLTYTALDPTTHAASVLASVTHNAEGYKLHLLNAGRGSVKIKVTSSDHAILPLEKTVAIKDWIASDFATGLEGSVQLAIDANNNIYSADAGRFQILKVTPGGNVTTYAGTGQKGTADGSSATASFGLIQGIAMDNSGNIYVAEQYAVFRKISPNGTVSTIKAEKTHSKECYGLEFDSNGVLYGSVLTRINKISLTNGAYTLYAGGESGGSDNGTLTAAKFSLSPLPLAIVHGNMYVCDRGNALIRKIDMSAGLVSAFSGELQSGGVLGFTSSDGTALTAKFGGMYDIAADISGNLFVLESAALRKVDATGRVKTITRTGISGAPAIVRHPSGDLYVAAGGKLIKFSYQ